VQREEKAMNILLVRPKPDKETIGLQNVMVCEPLELEYIGGMLKSNGYSVKIIDMILEGKPIGYFIKKESPDVVCLTSYIAHVNIVRNYAKLVKKSSPECKVVVGGVHAEVVPEDFVDPNIDFIVRANGMKAILDIIKLVEAGKDASTIDEVYGKDKPPCIKDTKFNFAYPDRSLVERYRKKYYYMFHNPCALIKTSFGCPYQCSFCFCRQITDGHYFTRELSSIIDELKSIEEKEIYIVDDDFLVDRGRLLEFCKLLKENHIEKKFLIYGRADFIASNEDIIEEFSKYGLRAVIVGLESSNEEELKKYNKKSSVDINEKAIKILKKHDVECYGTLILGTDWEDSDFDRLYKWIRRLDIKFVNLQPFTPLPGTPLFHEYKEDLIIPRDEYEKWDLAHLTVKPSKISISRYYWNIIKLYYKITMNPRNVFKMVRQYGLCDNIKLGFGASKITWQYACKMIKGR
jgi:hopanoid C-3 methylase